MTNREELPVWAKILLGIPVPGDRHSQCAVQPSDSSAPALHGNSERPRYLLRQDRILHNERLRGRMLLSEAVQ
jgi:hypothetical protein